MYRSILDVNCSVSLTKIREIKTYLSYNLNTDCSVHLSKIIEIKIYLSYSLNTDCSVHLTIDISA